MDTAEVSDVCTIQLQDAAVSTLGATVLSWRPGGGDDVLWVSPDASFEPGTAIRGGIPVCWPWFARDPAFPDGPSHGLVRTRVWSVQDTGADHVTLAIEHADAARFAPFRLTLEVRVAADLTVRLTHHNLTDAAQDCRGALHTYLRADASNAVVHGLGPARAWDKVAGEHRVLNQPVRFAPPTDLVVPTDGLAVLDDGSRRVEVHRGHAPDVVLWNPGAQRPADVPEGGEHDFVCVEAAAVTEPWTVPAGASRTLSMRLVRKA